MTSLKDEIIGNRNEKHTIMIYMETFNKLKKISTEDIELTIMKVVRQGLTHLKISADFMNHIGINLSTDQNIKKLEKEENAKEIIPLIVSKETYQKLSEFSGDLTIQDFLRILLSYTDSINSLNDSEKKSIETNNKNYNQSTNSDLIEGKLDIKSLQPSEYSYLSPVLWIFGISLFGIGDTITTYLSIISGNVELNPLTNFLITINPITLITFKIGIISGLYILYYIYREKHMDLTSIIMIPGIMTFIGTFLTFNNLFLIYGG